MLEDRSVVVVGAGDIGRATIARLRDLGARVCVWDADRRALDSLLDAGPDGGGITTLAVDITDENAVADAAIQSERVLGSVTGVVTTAAVLHLAPVEELSLADWRRTIDVNLTGTFLVCRALLPALRRNGGGSIVNVASIGGLAGEPEMSHYCASKFGVIGFTQSLAREEGRHAIRVNTVCPGAVASRMNDATLDMYAQRLQLDRRAVLDDVVAQTPLGRLARPGDVADAIAFLLSDLSAFITGESIAITGGLRY